jgi:DtxR family transcriptional regulator, Mn-dependent transcriptional regulator
VPDYTPAVQDYAKAIYALQERDGTVTTAAIAERLDVTPASASSMVRKLTEQGLVEHQPYKGVTLTDCGRKLALEMVRHHRLLETYLSVSLGMPWDRVHAEAEVLEHVISEDLEARIAAKLGNPTHDPHGDPIPAADLTLAPDDTRALVALEPGDHGTLARVADAEPEMLRYLSARGIAPGATLTVVDKQPFGGPLFVAFGDETLALGGRLAASMRVRAA